MQKYKAWKEEQMEKSMLTYETISHFETIIDIDTLTNNQKKEI